MANKRVIVPPRRNPDGSYDPDVVDRFYQQVCGIFNGNGEISTPLQIGNSPNYSTFEADGTLVFSGDATTYDDLPPVPILLAKVGGTGIPTLATFTGNIQQYTFAVNDYVYGVTEVLHKYKEGTDLSIHIHWATNGSDGTDRGVKWEMEYSVANGSTAYSYSFPSSTTVSYDDTIPASTASLSHQISSLGSIDGSALKIGAYIVYRFRRIASATTAPTSDPFALAIGFHAEQDTTGSRGLFTK